MHARKIRRAALGFLLLSIGYVGALLWLDHGRGLLGGINGSAGILPALLLCSLLSYLARYGRWHWLMHRSGFCLPYRAGFFAYIAGFAFTLSPGKVGELVRIRYFHPMGVPAEKVVSAFVLERMLDLLVVLALAALAARGHDLLPSVVMFVLGILCVVALIASQPRRLLCVSDGLRHRGMRAAARFLEVLAHGFAGARVWLNPTDLLVACTTGLFAWGITAWSFYLLLEYLNLHVPLWEALPLYPLAMLAGVATMLPGGIGSTEIAIVLLLYRLGIDTSPAALAAVSIRLATLWFATLLGLISLLGIELKRGGAGSAAALPGREK